VRGKAPLIGFLLLQVVVIALWATSLLPLMSANAPPFTSVDAQIWSGGAEAHMVNNFRQGTTTEAAAPFKVYGELLYATLLALGSIATIFVARMFFARGKGLIAAAALVATLALGAGAAWMIVDQWSASTMFPPGSVNTGWLYMTTRTALIGLGVAYVLVVAYLGLIIAEFVKADAPRGFNFVVLNWVIAVAVWTLLYASLFVIPSLSAPHA
jgi:heme/copper-type cytochrome/quinol oxidase subunit 3